MGRCIFVGRCQPRRYRGQHHAHPVPCPCGSFYPNNGVLGAPARPEPSRARAQVPLGAKPGPLLCPRATGSSEAGTDQDNVRQACHTRVLGGWGARVLWWHVACTSIWGTRGCQEGDRAVAPT